MPKGDTKLLAMALVAAWRGAPRLIRVDSTREALAIVVDSGIRGEHVVEAVEGDPELALAAVRRLCQELLEPLQSHFGRIAIRSAYRSAAVNEYGNKHGFNCASNDANAADHIWDLRDRDGCMGATACIIVPWFVDRYQKPGDWQRLAWWIHDHLHYATMYFFPKLWAVNLQWHERPSKRINSYAAPKGCLTKPGMANHGGNHSDAYVGLPIFDPGLCTPTAVKPYCGVDEGSLEVAHD